MDFNALTIAKFAANSVVGIGVGKIVKDVIANNVAEPEKTSEKLFIYAGAFAIGGIVKDASKTYTSAKIDKAVADWKQFRAAKEDTPKTEEQ